MSSAVESGKDGKVQIGSTDVYSITRWTFEKQVNTNRFASSSTGGYKKTVAGVPSGQGSIEGKWDRGLASPIAEGTAGTLQLYTNASAYYSVPAIIKNFRLSVDIDSGDPTAFTADFETDGAWTEPSLS